MNRLSTRPRATQAKPIMRTSMRHALHQQRHDIKYSMVTYLSIMLWAGYTGHPWVVLTIFIATVLDTLATWRLIRAKMAAPLFNQTPQDHELN